MSTENIKKLPIGRLADKDCALFMWVTFPPFKEMGEALKAWGFKYRTVALVRIKQNKKSDSSSWRVGYRTRASAEVCVLATKGSPKRCSRGIHQVVIPHIGRYNEKSEEAGRRIEQLMGDVSKAELLAREKADDWNTWGNEAPDGTSISELKAVQTAAYVLVPHDLTRVKPKIFSNLTKRQLLCFGAAVMIGLPVSFLLRVSGNISLVIVSMMIVMPPLLFLVTYEKDGQPLEVIAKHFVESKFIRPKERPYKTDNYYAASVRQCRLDKEVEAIVLNPKGEKIGEYQAAK